MNMLLTAYYILTTLSTASYSCSIIILLTYALWKSLGRITPKKFMVWLPYITVWKFLNKIATVYILATPDDSNTQNFV